jgi:hypothetical protein
MTLYDDLLKMHVPVDTVYDGNGCFFAMLRVGSNCPQGGDAGHGGRTLIELVNEGMACEVHVANGPEAWVVRNPSMVRLVLGGDMEHDTITTLLHGIAGLLRNNYVPCLESSEPKCHLCMFRQQRVAGLIKAKSMPCRALMQRWEDDEEEFERSLEEDLAAMEDEYQVMSTRLY